MLSSISIGLFFQLAANQPTAVPVASVSVGDAHRQEVALLHRVLPADSLRSLDLWDEQASAWRPARANEAVDARVPVLMLHFWASWCKPCRDEFPVWQDLGPQLEAVHKGKVRILYVAIQTNNHDMERFLLENKAKMPAARWHLDVGERLAAAIRRGLVDDRLPLPVTLWIDRQHVVRQALVGPIGYRRAEVVDSTARMVRLMEQLDSAVKAR